MGCAGWGGLLLRGGRRIAHAHGSVHERGVLMLDAHRGDPPHPSHPVRYPFKQLQTNPDDSFLALAGLGIVRVYL